jgi:hypothetical protein
MAPASSSQPLGPLRRKFTPDGPGNHLGLLQLHPSRLRPHRLQDARTATAQPSWLASGNGTRIALDIQLRHRRKPPHLRNLAGQECGRPFLENRSARGRPAKIQVSDVGRPPHKTSAGRMPHPTSSRLTRNRHPRFYRSKQRLVLKVVGHASQFLVSGRCPISYVGDGRQGSQ